MPIKPTKYVNIHSMVGIAIKGIAAIKPLFPMPPLAGLIQWLDGRNDGVDTLYDRTTPAYDIELVDSPSTVFAGASRLDFGILPQLDINYNVPLSTVAKFKTTDAGVIGIIGNYDNGGGPFSIGIYLSAGKFRSQLKDSSGNTANITFDGAAYNDGEWHEVIDVLDYPTHSLYVDGVLKATMTMTNLVDALTSTNSLQVGTRGIASLPLVGEIIDVAIYPYALSDDQRAGIQTRTGAFLYLPLQGDALDVSGNGYDGTATGAITYGTQSESHYFAEQGGAKLVGFDGSTTQGTIPGSEALFNFGADDFDIEFDVYVDWSTGNGYQCPINKGADGAADSSFIIQILSDRIRFLTYDAGGYHTSAVAKTLVEEGNHSFKVSKSGSVASWEMDGLSIVSTGDAATTLRSSSNVLMIGTYDTSFAESWLAAPLKRIKIASGVYDNEWLTSNAYLDGSGDMIIPDTNQETPIVVENAAAIYDPAILNDTEEFVVGVGNLMGKSLSGSTLKGALHFHTTESDGNNSPSVMVNAYKTAGYDFVSASDHNVLCPDPSVAGITFIANVEETDNTVFHLGHLGDSAVYYPVAGQPLLNAVFNNGGFTVINHPSWGSLPLYGPYLASLNGYDAIEVYNSLLVGEGNENAEDKWDYLLERGINVFGVASDDAHDISHVNKGWVEVFSDNDSASIVAAMKAGEFYSSTGPSISSITISGKDISVACPEASTIEFITSGLVAAQTNLNSTSASYAAVTGDAYVRIKITDDVSGKFAWSNAYVVHNPSTHSGWEITNLSLRRGIKHNNGMAALQQKASSATALGHSSLYFEADETTPKKVSYADLVAWVSGNYNTWEGFKALTNGTCVNTGGLIYEEDKTYTPEEYARIIRAMPNTCGAGEAIPYEITSGDGTGPEGALYPLNGESVYLVEDA